MNWKENLRGKRYYCVYKLEKNILTHLLCYEKNYKYLNCEMMKFDLN